MTTEWWARLCTTMRRITVEPGAMPVTSVAITGGTGSLGRALVRRWMAPGSPVRRIVVLSRDEFKQAQMAAEFPDPEDRLRFMLGDVRDQARLEQAFWGVGSVVHCAALKRVDKIAYDPEEATKTNVLGSSNVIRAAARAGVSRVLMISSDKAVNPTTFYGVTKQMMEHEAILANTWTYPQGMRVSVARWGNVMDSRGGVVELFRAAVARGEALPLTHPSCTRFWLTLDTAAADVELALERMHGGEIFVPRGLARVRIVDLAKAMSPVEPVIVGLRDATEKIHEELWSVAEGERARVVGAFVGIPPTMHSWCSDDPWDTHPRLGSAGGRVSSEEPHLSVEDIKRWLGRD